MIPPKTPKLPSDLFDKKDVLRDMKKLKYKVVALLVENKRITKRVKDLEDKVALGQPETTPKRRTWTWCNKKEINEIIRLRDEEGKGMRHIAEVTGRATSTINKVYFKEKARLKKEEKAAQDKTKIKEIEEKVITNANAQGRNINISIKDIENILFKDAHIKFEDKGKKLVVCNPAEKAKEILAAMK